MRYYHVHLGLWPSKSLSPAFFSFRFHLSCLFPLPCSAPSSPPRMSNTCYLTAWAPSGLGEAQKPSPALPAALVAYLNPTSQPLPQRSALNHCLHLICSLSTKLLSASHFPTPPHTYISSVCVCVCVCVMCS